MPKIFSQPKLIVLISRISAAALLQTYLKAHQAHQDDCREYAPENLTIKDLVWLLLCYLVSTRGVKCVFYMPAYLVLKNTPDRLPAFLCPGPQEP